MKRKNLKVGLRVELKEGTYLSLPAGTVGVVDRIETEEYTGFLICRVKFEGRDDPTWVTMEEIRIKDKVRKAKPSEPAPEPLDARHTIRLPSSVKAKAKRIGAAAVIAAIVAAEDVE